jgi:site-specific DNA recombinase
MQKKPPEPRPTASILTRLSKQAGSTNLSLDGSGQDCVDLADRLGADIIGQHADDGVSGSVRNRPGLVAWLDDAEQQRADILIVPHADRVTREGVSALSGRLLDLLRGKDPTTGKVTRRPVRLVTVNGLDTAREYDLDELVRDMQAAERELARIARRNKDTRRRLVEAGRHTGGPPPFGTQVVVRDGLKYLDKDETEAGVLRDATAKLIAGQSMRAVVRWLNEEGWRTRRGLEWQRSSLRQTLLSDATRTHVLDGPTRKELVKRLKPGKDRSRVHAGGRPQARLLSGGIALCASCGRAMTTSAGRYICSSTSGGFTCSLTVSIDSTEADRYVERQFLARYGDAPDLEEVVVVSGAEGIDKAERALEVAQAKLLESPDAENLAKYAKAQEALKRAEARPPKRERVIRLTDRTVGEMWQAGDGAERARLLRERLHEPIVIRPATRGSRSGVDTSRIDVTFRADVNPDTPSILWTDPTGQAAPRAEW